MKPSIKVAVVCSFISIVITMTLHSLGKSLLAYETSSFMNLFLLLASIAGGLFLYKKTEKFSKKSFIEDIKVALQGGLIFTLLISGFVYYYHTKINTSIIDEKVDDYIEVISENVPNEAVFLEMKKGDKTWKDKTYLDYIENQEDSARGFISAFSLSIMHTLVGLVLTIFFSIFTTIILRKVVLRDWLFNVKV